MFGFVWILSSCFGLAVVFYGLLLCSLNFELELEYNTNIVYTKKMRSFSIPKLRLLFHVWLLNSHRRTSLLENLCVSSSKHLIRILNEVMLSAYCLTWSLVGSGLLRVSNLLYGNAWIHRWNINQSLHCTITSQITGYNCSSISYTVTGNFNKISHQSKHNAFYLLGFDQKK